MAKTKSPYILTFILVLGLVLRLINIDQSFWLDEASQAQMSSLPVSQIWFGRGADFHPPMFYFLAHAWLSFGRSEIWLRLLPLTFGLADMYLIYVFAKDLFPDKYINIKHWTLDIKHLASLMLAVSPFHIYYSQEFRMYSLLSFLGTLSIYLLYRKKYFLLGLVNALMLYTHYSGIFLIFAQTVYVLFYARKHAKNLAVSHLLIIVIFLPWLPQFFRQLGSGLNIDHYLPGWRNVLSISPLKAFPVIIFKIIAGRISFISRYLYGIYITFVFFVTFASLGLASMHKRFLFIWAIVPVFSLLLTSLLLPQNQPFRVIYILPAFVLLMVQACLRYPRLFTALIFYIFLVGDIAYFTRPRLQREQWRQAMAFLQTRPGPVLIKSSSVFAPIDWYAPGLSVYPVVSSYPAEYSSVAARLDSVANLPELYLMEYLTGLTDPGLNVEKALRANHFIQTGIYDYPGVGFIYRYQKI